MRPALFAQPKSQRRAFRTCQCCVDLPSSHGERHSHSSHSSAASWRLAVHGLLLHVTSLLRIPSLLHVTLLRISLLRVPLLRVTMLRTRTSSSFKLTQQTAQSSTLGLLLLVRLVLHIRLLLRVLLLLLLLLSAMVITLAMVRRSVSFVRRWRPWWRSVG